MAVVFFLCRIVWGYYLTYCYWAHSFDFTSGRRSMNGVPLWTIDFFRVLSVMLNGL